jgi:hypothetical protein
MNAFVRQQVSTVINSMFRQTTKTFRVTASNSIMPAYKSKLFNVKKLIKFEHSCTPVDA